MTAMDSYSLHDYFAIFRRRRTVFVLTVLVFVALTIAVTVTWSTYRSTATIQVRDPDIPQGMTQPIGASPASMIQALADQRIEQIQQQVTATSTLVEIITKFNLYAKRRESTPMTDIVNAMRKKIKLNLVSADLANPSAAQHLEGSQLSAIAFTMDFTYGDPLTAQQVCNELVTRFLDADIKRRRSESKSATGFLANQITALEQTLADQERKIGEFRAEHPDIRPETLAYTQQIAATVEINIQDVERQLQAFDRSRGDLLAQLANVEPYSRVVADGQLLTTPAIQLKALQAKYSTLIGQYGSVHPDVVKLRHQIEALQAQVGSTPETANLQTQLADARTQLAAAQKTYGGSHPDVVALRRQVTSLEGQLATKAKNPTQGSLIKKDADNPAYLMIVSELQSADSQYKALQAQRDQLRQQRDRYRQVIAETPAYEEKLASLSRDYENAQLRYREMKEKKLTADMNDEMEQGRMSQRLDVIEPPDLPTDTRPGRMLILMAGLMLSVASGGGGVLVAERMSRSIHGTRHLTKLVGVPPLAAIPHIFTRRERRRRLLMRTQAAMAVMGLLVVGGVFFDQNVMPLEVVWTLLGRKFGLPT